MSDWVGITGPQPTVPQEDDVPCSAKAALDRRANPAARLTNEAALNIGVFLYQALFQVTRSTHGAVHSIITLKPSQIFDGPDQEEPSVAAAAAYAIIPVSRQSGDTWEGGPGPRSEAALSGGLR